VVAVIHGSKNLINGIHKLRLTVPRQGQYLLSGYPTAISGPYAILFTDNTEDPSTAQLALLVPNPLLSYGYFVLLGSYIRGVDSMEWDVFVPERQRECIELVSAPNALSSGELIFKRAQSSNVEL
jgi:hypothetical protein